MARKTYEELSEIMKKEGVKRIFSWTKIDTFNTSPYEYYLKYIAKAKEDKTDCIYGNLGAAVHEILEKYYSGQIAFEEMQKEFEESWITSFDISDLKFDRNDEEKNQKIANKYHQDLQHFFKFHKTITNQSLHLEEFAKTKIGNELFQGYIDACFKDEDGNYNIIDWKTSSKYQGTKALEKCGQLVIYAISLLQQGIPIDKIRIGWNFIKYVTVLYSQKKTDENGKYLTKERIIERYEIGDKLQSNVKMWLKHYHYSDTEISQYLEQLLLTNNIDILPQEIKEKFKISDCYVFVPFTAELAQQWEELVANTIKQIDYCYEQYKETGSDKAWWDTPEQVKEQSYYFATLCNYSPNLHKPYAEYLENLAKEQEAKQNATNLLTTQTNVAISADEEDMSWLNDIE